MGVLGAFIYMPICGMGPRRAENVAGRIWFGMALLA